jgi:hypothetical protein
MLTDHLTHFIEKGDQEYVRQQGIVEHMKQANEFLENLGERVLSNVDVKIDKIIDKSHRVVVE